ETGEDDKETDRKMAADHPACAIVEQAGRRIVAEKDIPDQKIAVVQHHEERRKRAQAVQIAQMNARRRMRVGGEWRGSGCRGKRSQGDGQVCFKPSEGMGEEGFEPPALSV